jgi:uncharacterized protein YdhG (YjbR/CyaY superfamily)
MSLIAILFIKHNINTTYTRDLIKQAAPQTNETISYGIPAFKQNKVLVYYAVYKKYLSFYPTPNSIAHFKESYSISY